MPRTLVGTTALDRRQRPWVHYGNYAGLELWYDGSQPAAGQADGAVAASWPDRGPKARHALASGAGGLGATWRAAGLNGRGAYEFGGGAVAACMGWNRAAQGYAAMSMTDPHTVYFVCQNTNTVDDGTVFTQGTVFDTTSSVHENAFRYNQSGSIIHNYATGGVTVAGINKLDTAVRIWRLEFSGGTGRVWSQKLLVGGPTGSLVMAAVLGTFTLGARIANQRHFTGLIGEFLFFNRLMTTIENDDIHAQFAKKYTITLLA